MTLVARGADAATVISGMRTALRGIDPTLPLGNVADDGRAAGGGDRPRRGC